MRLTELGFSTEDVVVKPAKEDKPAQTITVRGLSASDLAKIIRVHGPTMVQLFDDLTGQKTGKLEGETLDLTNTATVAMTLFDSAPDLVADLIVLASDEPNTVEGFKVASRLPLPVQIDALQKIAKLTFEEHGGLPQLIETITLMFGGVDRLMTQLRASSAGGLESVAQ